MSDLRLIIDRSTLEPVTLGTCALMLGPIVIFRSHTLELPWRNNESRVSCIPAGTYSARLSMSPRFKVELWEVLNVPKRTGIRIHAANFVRELHGCIALGKKIGDIDKDGKIDVARSQEAMRMFARACAEYRTMTVEIRNPEQ